MKKEKEKEKKEFLSLKGSGNDFDRELKKSIKNGKDDKPIYTEGIFDFKNQYNIL